MKKLLFGFFILMFAISCKKGAAKLDINDIEAHRAYQVGILKQNIDPYINISALKGLITEYRNLELENKESNPNYMYLT